MEGRQTGAEFVIIETTYNMPRYHILFQPLLMIILVDAWWSPSLSVGSHASEGRTGRTEDTLSALQHCSLPPQPRIRSLKALPSRETMIYGQVGRAGLSKDFQIEKFGGPIIEDSSTSGELCHIIVGN